MKHYVYQAKILPTYLRSKKSEEALQALLDEKASEGWRLVSTQYVHQSAGLLVIFEKESDV